MKKFLFFTLFFVLQHSLEAQNNINFSAKTLDNSELNFSEVNSQSPTLLSFWATWCKPCRAEMKHLENYYNKYKSKGFTVIGVNQDSPKSMAKVKSFVATHNLTFPIVLDPNQEIFQKFNSQSIPLSVLINTNGEIVYTHIGYLPGDEIELEQEIMKLLEK
ncbi:MAG: TlpA family protein disulfide reductase [Ignavibacteriales bacterium]|nr:TlpA family protein disulfide reductase [Ignavibacteriales bacterium]MCB9258530.1 TlpA family protein disulfide reductase [Ignavibacteriales bacterium]